MTVEISDLKHLEKVIKSLACGRWACWACERDWQAG